MAPAFLKSEYNDRLARVRTEMAARGLDAVSYTHLTLPTTLVV